MTNQAMTYTGEEARAMMRAALMALATNLDNMAALGGSGGSAWIPGRVIATVEIEDIPRATFEALRLDRCGVDHAGQRAQYVAVVTEGSHTIRMSSEWFDAGAR